MSKKGTLFIVATPIGNLEDITLRALRILNEVDIIACEDTRQTLKLLNHYEIKKPLESYYEHNKIKKGNFLIEKLIDGYNIALVSDAGTPGISDPGEDLIKLCYENDIKVTMCPGPVAAIMGLILSGKETGRFVFEGFLPVNKKSRKEHIDAIKDEIRTIILYEAPHKLKYTLKDLYDNLGDRNITLARELTKKYEEIEMGKISDFINKYETDKPKGEFVLIIEGKDKSLVNENESIQDITVIEHVDLLISQGISKKEAIVNVSRLRGLRKSEVYNAYELELRKRK